MLSWEELKTRPEIVGNIDWEITPAQAFEAYQIKSTTARRGLEAVYYFYLSTWRGENKVLLVERTYVDSQEVAQAPAPAELVEAAAQEGEGQDMPRGQLPLSRALKQWLRRELGLEPGR
ncbi:MAG: hypothetical protein K9K65_08040 [Desulfarculaceae bacterium]|nr:hypothetical protein [Desulfarculaceae bacterium]MCF8048075.1 hypothetical protein [Desulfarculaceae bacterium]MCF8097776.1 hypothetical protein [Desulfarculaceae bacterium]MCF8123660.1 hypothetical protein [Desulfarculaceae bacterium]